MEAWAWVGFGSAVVVTFVVTMWAISRLVKPLSATAGGTILLLTAMIYSIGVTWAVATHLLSQ